MKSSQIKKAANWIKDSESILIGAGAGLSIESGLNYTDTVAFKRDYPDMVKKGFKMKLHLMSYYNLTQSELWRYYAQHIKDVVTLKPHPSYGRLLDIANTAKDKDYFVITTNVDKLFVKNGFSDQKIYTPQGSYFRIQCMTPCSQETWSSVPIMERLYPLIDKKTCSITDPSAIPKCPNCGGKVFLNLRSADWFVHKPYEEEADRYYKWVDSHKDKKLTLIEIGSGFNTPVWIRWPFEQMTYQNPNTRFIRINPQYSGIPDEIKHKSISFRAKAMESITALWKGLGLDKVVKINNDN